MADLSQFEVPGFQSVSIEGEPSRSGTAECAMPGSSEAIGTDSADPLTESRFEVAGFAADPPPQPSIPGEMSQYDIRLENGSATEVNNCESASRSQLAGPLGSGAVVHRVHRPWLFLRIGEIIGDFRLLAWLGRGIRGAVYLAEQPSLAHRRVVLKITPRDGREHLSLAQLRHPNIVPLYAVQDVPSRDFRLLCMPYLGGAPLALVLSELNSTNVARRTGRDLLDALDRVQDPLSVPEDGPARGFFARASYIQAICRIGACLADALHFAHEHNLVHLDLKPSNILLAADGTPMLLDFHLAQPPLRPNDSTQQRLGGTPKYMSPEQKLAMKEILRHRSISVTVDRRADIYGLGLVLGEMLGVSGLISPEERQASKARMAAGVPAGLADIIAKCLAHDPADRYPTAAELAEDFRRQLVDLPLKGVRNRSVLERIRKWSRRHPQAPARAGRAAAIASALVLGAWLTSGGDARQRLGAARSRLAEGRRQMVGRDYAAAIQTLDSGLAAINGSWMLSHEGWPFRSQDLRRELTAELARARSVAAALELHELVERLRLLFGTDFAPGEGVRSLERRLRTMWEGRERILAQNSRWLDQELAERLRVDLLDLGILWAALRPRLAEGSDLPSARREALRVLDEAERQFGTSAVAARERQSHAEALGLIDVARMAARCCSEHPPRTAWEHYALGRSLLSVGDLEAAAVEFDRATDLEPQDLWAQFSRGLCAFRSGRFDTALRAFEICVALSPGNAESYHNRGQAHAALGHIELAKRDHQRAVDLRASQVKFPLPRS
jgi:serine/threonine protein kinase